MKEKKLKEVFVTDVNEYPYLHEILDDEDVENLKIFKKDKKIIPFNYLTKKQFKEIKPINFLFLLIAGIVNAFGVTLFLYP